MAEIKLKPMLAGKYDQAKQKYPVYFPPKLDGIRCLITEKGPLSRMLKEIPNLHIRNTLSHLGLVGLDGELIIGDPRDPDVYRNTTSSVMRIKGEPEFTFHVFDDFMAGGTWEERFQSIINEDSYGHYEGVPVQLVPHPLILNEAQLEEMEAQYLLEGYEGGMLRSPDGPYKMGRSTAIEGYLLKLKRFEDSECEILGFEELMHNGNVGVRNALGRTERSSHKANMIGLGTLGTLLVRDIYSGVEFRIGNGKGLTAELRQEIWNNKEKYLGSIWNYRFFPGGVKDKPRFPSLWGPRVSIDMPE